jgi:hypothetical protein
MSVEVDEASSDARQAEITFSELWVTTIVDTDALLLNGFPTPRPYLQRQSPFNDSNLRGCNPHDRFVRLDQEQWCAHGCGAFFEASPEFMRVRRIGSTKDDELICQKHHF